uniref:TBC1 domain family member 19-like n=1 Tax=Sinocyclocheilus anshuiensis TaxID=1608454 RepID=A0A671NGM3_9TELE
MMDESAELAVSITQIVQRLKGTHLHSQLEKQAKECLHKPEIKLETLKDDVRRLLKASGMTWLLPPPGHPRAPPEHTKEPLEYMRKAQVNWEKRILKSLNSMCTELGIPLARKRPVPDQKELTNKWNEMGTDEPDLSKFRPVYAPKDFLEVLVGLRNPNNERSEDLTVRSHWGLIQVSLNVRDIPQMREMYPELGLTYGQLGIDDHTHVPPDLFESEHIHIGKKVVSEQDSAAAQQYSKQGCPTGLRAQLWSLILNTTNDPEDITHYEQLKARVINHDLLVDNLIYKDVKLTTSNDDYYFVFEDYLYQVSECMFRDEAETSRGGKSASSSVSQSIRSPSKSSSSRCTISSPSAAVQWAELHFALSPSTACSLAVGTVAGSRTWSYGLSSTSGGIVSLCLQFERLLQTHLPQLFYHLRETGAQPLRIAFKWIVRAFSGYLSTDQLLLLWDRILGYDSLEIVAVLAAAVFAFRAENLMEVTSLASAEVVTCLCVCVCAKIVDTYNLGIPK